MVLVKVGSHLRLLPCLLLRLLFGAGALFSYNVSCLFATDTRLQQSGNTREREKERGDSSSSNRQKGRREKKKEKKETGILSLSFLVRFWRISDAFCFLDARATCQTVAMSKRKHAGSLTSGIVNGGCQTTIGSRAISFLRQDIRTSPSPILVTNAPRPASCDYNSRRSYRVYRSLTY